MPYNNNKNNSAVMVCEQLMENATILCSEKCGPVMICLILSLWPLINTLALETGNRPDKPSTKSRLVIYLRIKLIRNQLETLDHHSAGEGPPEHLPVSVLAHNFRGRSSAGSPLILPGNA